MWIALKIVLDFWKIRRILGIRHCNELSIKQLTPLWWVLKGQVHGCFCFSNELFIVTLFLSSVNNCITIKYDNIS